MRSRGRRRARAARRRVPRRVPSVGVWSRRRRRARRLRVVPPPRPPAAQRGRRGGRRRRRADERDCRARGDRGFALRGPSGWRPRVYVERLRLCYNTDARPFPPHSRRLELTPPPSGRPARGRSRRARARGATSTPHRSRPAWSRSSRCPAAASTTWPRVAGERRREHELGLRHRARAPPPAESSGVKLSPSRPPPPPSHQAGAAAAAAADDGTARGRRALADLLGERRRLARSASAASSAGCRLRVRRCCRAAGPLDLQAAVAIPACPPRGAPIPGAGPLI